MGHVSCAAAGKQISTNIPLTDSFSRNNSPIRRTRRYNADPIDMVNFCLDPWLSRQSTFFDQSFSQRFAKSGILVQKPHPSPLLLRAIRSLLIGPANNHCHGPPPSQLQLANRHWKDHVDLSRHSSCYGWGCSVFFRSIPTLWRRTFLRR